MRVSAALALLLALVLALPAEAKQVRLKAFRSCSALVDYGRQFAARGPGAGPPTPFVGVGDLPVPPLRRDGGLPPPMPDVPAAEGDSGGGESGTNVQELGVDEPDVVKTDGGRIFAVAGETLRAVDPDGPGLLDSLELAGYGHQLLLHGDRLLVIAQDAPLGARASLSPVESFDEVVALVEVDVSDPANLRVLRTERIRGVHVAARLTDRTARVVVWSRPRAALEPELSAQLRGWLPRRVTRSPASRRVSFRRSAPCRRVLRPASFSGTDTLTVLTIDLERGLPAVDSDAILSGGQIAYASKGSLYVATPRWTAVPMGDASPPERASTTIHRFDISEPGETVYRASGAVPGYLLNQFSMSEAEGVLRVASTEEPAWWPGGTDERSESRVTTLTPENGVLRELGHVGGLGKGERIYAVRFIGDAGYVVTFRQIDPLYTIDLSRPAAPRVRGELKIRGYSAYLHPVSEDLLLGVGQDATEQGRQLGTQLSLFDVSDLDNPRRLHATRLAGFSDAEYDHHAFLWWGPEKLAVIPLSSYEPDQEFTGAIGFGVDVAAGISERGRAIHEYDSEHFPWPIARSFVTGGKLYTLSGGGLERNSLTDLSQAAWLPFPTSP
jgi:hypothetical protein